MRSLFPRGALALAALVAAAALQGGASHAAPLDAAQGLLIEPVVWQFDKDYPTSLPGDTSIPVDTVYIKTHDATDWMSTYDDNPNAVSGPASIEQLIDVYAAQGVEVAAWFVPKGLDYDRQLEMALQVIDAGVTALYADLEPFQGFCFNDCHALAENFWYRVREARPNARLGVIYDPRPWWWDQSATAKWFTVADAALPMCYWESYAGQVPWMDPAGCVTQARADLSTLAPGRNLDYIPMIQGNSTPERIQASLDAAVRAESERVSIWRRGVTSLGVWNMIAAYTEPDGPHCALNLVDGCLIREASQPDIYLVQGGAAFHLVDWDTFVSMGFDLRDVQVVPLGLTHELPKAPADGTLINEFGDERTFVVYGGARFWVPSPEAFEVMGFQWEAIRLVPPGGLAQVSPVPRDYVRLSEFGAADEFLVLYGSRIPLDADGLAALEAAGRAGEPQYVVPPGGLEQVPLAQVKRGDADCDDNVSVIDAILVLQQSIRLPQAGLCTHVAGDVTCDGWPLPPDALLILLFVAGDPPEPGAGCPPIGEPQPATLPLKSGDAQTGETSTPAPVETSEPTMTPTPATGSPPAPTMTLPPVSPSPTYAGPTPTATAAEPTPTPTPTPGDTDTPTPTVLPPSPSPTTVQ